MCCLYKYQNKEITNYKQELNKLTTIYEDVNMGPSKGFLKTIYVTIHLMLIFILSPSKDPYFFSCRSNVVDTGCISFLHSMWNFFLACIYT